MDTMLLMIAFIAFFALVAAWLLLPASAAPTMVPSRVVNPRPTSPRTASVRI